MNIDKKALQAAAVEIYRNAERLLDDAKYLEEYGRYPSAYSLSILAQEEYGKAFMIHLATEDAIPWTEGLDRALRNHRCKQLAALIMEFLQRKDFSELLQDPDRFRGASTLPEHLMDAIQIIVHEHIGKLARDEWVDDSSRPVHPIANRIARGLFDREKQEGFYVHVDSNGHVYRSPSLVTNDRCQSEIERTRRISEVFFVNNGVLSACASFELPKIVAAFRVFSGLMPVDEFNEKWWA